MITWEDRSSGADLAHGHIIQVRRIWPMATSSRCGGSGQNMITWEDRSSGADLAHGHILPVLRILQVVQEYFFLFFLLKESFKIF
jgi:hypothetical protein